HDPLYFSYTSQVQAKLLWKTVVPGLPKGGIMVIGRQGRPVVIFLVWKIQAVKGGSPGPGAQGQVDRATGLFQSLQAQGTRHHFLQGGIVQKYQGFHTDLPGHAPPGHRSIVFVVGDVMLAVLLQDRMVPGAMYATIPIAGQNGVVRPGDKGT